MHSDSPAWHQINPADFGDPHNYYSLHMIKFLIKNGENLHTE